MVLKTFNVGEAVYNQFSSFCKEHGISMSRQVEMFMESFISGDPKARKDYLDKLDRIRKGKFILVKTTTRYTNK